MGALKQQLIRIGYFDEYAINERQRIEDMENAWHQQEQEDAMKQDFANGLPFSEDAPPEMYWPVDSYWLDAIANVMICQNA